MCKGHDVFTLLTLLTCLLLMTDLCYVRFDLKGLTSLNLYAAVRHFFLARRKLNGQSNIIEAYFHKKEPISNPYPPGGAEIEGI